jgi:hypothetical protein
MDGILPELLLTAVALGAWGYSIYNPRFIRRLTKPKGELSKKSAWIRSKTTHFLQRFVWWTFPAIALAMIWGDFVHMGFYTYFLLSGFYAGAGALYSLRLKRQWLLWQQLGYDGPPELEQQRESLQKPLNPIH